MEEEGQYNIVDGSPKDLEYLPSRFKSSNVDRFVPVLKRVLAGQQEIRFNPARIGLSVATAMARVGDAALAVIRGHQFYSDVDADKLRKVWPNYKIGYDQNTHEVKVIQFRNIGPSLPTNILDATIMVEEPNFERTVAAFAWLYGTYHIIGHLTILGMLDDKIKQQLAEECNVSFQLVKPNEHIMSR